MDRSRQLLTRVGEGGPICNNPELAAYQLANSFNLLIEFLLLLVLQLNKIDLYLIQQSVLVKVKPEIS
jgi:hypothetical protein